ncbi:MAG: response regulator [Alphaproteobacteria bacterium]|nr:response regulator [Alphaproteobacteria bacterium]
MAKILIAEDDVSMRQFLKMALEKAGHEVKAAEDGLAALRIIETHPSFDLLLADIVMPGMDGIELSRKTGELHPETKIMFITGFTAVAMEQLAQDQPNGAPAVVSKPFHLKQIVEQIDQLLAA